VIHFFSWATGVSLELPDGYERAGSDGPTVTYGVVDEDTGRVDGASLTVQVLDHSDEPVDESTRTDAVGRLGDEAAGTGGVRVRDRSSRVVDGAPVEAVSLEAEGLYVVAAAAATEHRLLSIIGRSTDMSDLAVFDAALESMRFIEL